jgi:hypothetical protein
MDDTMKKEGTRKQNIRELPSMHEIELDALIFHNEARDQKQL